MKNNALGISVLILLLHGQPSVAQEADLPSTEARAVDEIIVSGQQDWSRHDGMKAFFDGDYKAAEIEFEREFLSLKRSVSARENAIEDAANGILRAQSSAAATSSTGSVVSTPNGGVSVADSGGGAPANIGVSTNFRNKRATGRTILTDGKVTYEDFAFSKYMSGLSEIQLGKFKEAKASFKQSLNYNGKNYDARMRLGLLNVQESNYGDAAKQLEKLDKMRKKCKKLSCDDMVVIRDATITLADAITKSAEAR